MTEKHMDKYDLIYLNISQDDADQSLITHRVSLHLWCSASIRLRKPFGRTSEVRLPVITLYSIRRVRFLSLLYKHQKCDRAANAEH